MIWFFAEIFFLIRSNTSLQKHLNFILAQDQIYLLLVKLFDSSLKGSFSIRKVYALNPMN